VEPAAEPTVVIRLWPTWRRPSRVCAPPSLVIGRSQKKLNRAQQLWHLSQRNPQAGGAAVVLTASALPGLAHTLQAGLLSHSLRAWNATATGFPDANGGHPTGRAALRSQKINQVSYSAISSYRPKYSKPVTWRSRRFPASPVMLEDAAIRLIEQTRRTGLRTSGVHVVFLLRRPSAVYLRSFVLAPASMSIVSHGAVSRSCSIPRYRSVVLILECP